MRHVQLAYSRPLDGLRGIAVALVVAFHANWLIGGWIGVDIFFVLSGYLITRLLLDELHVHQWINLAAFWGRRARRLLPALLVLVAAIAIADRFRRSPPSTAKWDIFGALTYSSNWVRVTLGRSYWDRFASPGLADHLWSLAIEEQFYLLWPVVMAAGLRRLAPLRRAAVLSVAALLAGVYTVVMFARTGDAGRVYLGTDTRIVALLAGAAVGAWAAAGLRLHPVVRRVIATLSILFLVNAAVRFNGAKVPVYRGGIVFVAFATACLLASLIGAQGSLPRLLSMRPLVWLGNRSYGLYLWHWPIFVALHVAARPHSSTVRRLLAIGVALLVSELSARVIELPLRRYVRRANPRWLVRAGGLIGVATIATLLPLGTAAVPTEAKAAPALTLPVPSAVTTTTPTTSTSVVASTTTSVAVVAEPVTTPPASAVTTVAPTTTLVPKVPPPPRDGPPRILVVGDSVAQRLAIAINRLPDRGGAVLDIQARAGCMLARSPIRTREGDNGIISDEPGVCPQIVESFGSFAAQTPHDAVLMLFGAGFFHDNEITTGVWTDACSTAFHDFMRAEIATAVTALGSGGAAVYAVSEAYYRAPNEGNYENLDNQTDCKNAILEEAAANGSFTLLKLGQIVCPSRSPCPFPDADIRDDGIHYDRAGATAAWGWLFPQMFPTG